MTAIPDVEKRDWDNGPGRNGESEEIHWRVHGLLQVDEQKGLDESVQVAQDKEDDQEHPDVEVSEEAPDPLHACSFGQADVDFGEAE